MWFFRAIFCVIPLFASSEISVIVSKKAQISTISTNDISKIFLSKTKRLPNGEIAQTVELDDENVKSEFYQQISKKNQKQLRAYWATMIFTGKGQPPKSINSIEELYRYLEQNQNAISYVDSSFVDSTKIKVLYVIK